MQLQALLPQISFKISSDYLGGPGIMIVDPYLAFGVKANRVSSLVH